MRSKGEHWRLSREIDRPSWASFEAKSYSLSSVPNKSELQAGRHTVSWGDASHQRADAGAAPGVWAKQKQHEHCS